MLFRSAEARQGLAQSLGGGWIVNPHVVVAAREVRPDPSSESWAEAGVGVAMRRPFGGTVHQADRGRLELSLQYRMRVSGAGRQGWVMAASVLW